MTDVQAVFSFPLSRPGHEKKDNRIVMRSDCLVRARQSQFSFTSWPVRDDS